MRREDSSWGQALPPESAPTIRDWREHHPCGLFGDKPNPPRTPWQARSSPVILTSALVLEGEGEKKPATTGGIGKLEFKDLPAIDECSLAVSTGRRDRPFDAKTRTSTYLEKTTRLLESRIGLATTR